ncbi:MAG: TRAP transporter large permease subunit, partial [Chloroflexota bacterium]
LSFNITRGLTALAGGNKVAMVFMAAFAALLLGLALPTSAVYLMTAILVAPSLIKLGIQPIVAHFFGWYYGLAAAISPPVAITCFITAGIAGADYMKTQWVACRLGIIIFIVPLMLAYAPELLMIGQPLNIALAVGTAVIGIVFLSAGLERYLLGRANWPQSILLFAAGIALMIPGVASDVTGLALGGVVVLWQWINIRRVKGHSSTG